MRLYLLKPKPREAELIKSPREVRLWHSLSTFNACEIKREREREHAGVRTGRQAK